MKRFRSNKAVVLLVVAIAVVIASGVAIAAVISEVVLTDTTSVRLRIVRTEANGFDSGWHTQPGPVIVQVQKGFFKIFQGSCSPTIVRAGETYIETPDLPVRAVATGNIKWTTSLIVPSGVDLRTSVPAPPCTPGGDQDDEDQDDD